jgi:hypothetical protein
MRKIFVSSALFLMALGCASTAGGQSARAWTAPKAGVWIVTARDEEKTRWTARMHMTRTRMNGHTAYYRGYFYWRSPDPDTETKGYEYFTGRFDRITGRLKLHGARARSVRGELGTGDYQAKLSRGSRIYDGSWAGENSIPGTWTARWSRSR